MRGRKSSLQVLEGGKVAGKIPAPPSTLDAAGKAEWKRVAPGLHERGLLNDGCAATLEAYCRAVSLCRTYSAILEEGGHVIRTEKGPATHPAFRQLMAAMREQRLFAAELALTPHRQGVGSAEGGKPADGWDSDLLA